MCHKYPVHVLHINMLSWFQKPGESRTLLRNQNILHGILEGILLTALGF